MRIRAVAFGVSVLSLCRAAGAAAPPPPPEDDVVVEDEPPPPSSHGYHLETPSKLGFGLEGYAGIATAFNSGEDRAHALAGGLARFRLHYFQLGGSFEITDSGADTGLGENPIEHWRAFGGFAGVFLPFDHWATFDATLGLGARTYGNSLSIYGDNGLSKTLTALTLRIGVSDRMTHKLIAPRIGAALAFSSDLSRVDVPWQRRYVDVDGNVSETNGATPIGAISISLVVSIGLEIGGRPR
ncbi:MAG TPA: hypothetical protein VHC69_11415 [Polyangiaceae bacterium]|nr:hypothetical protein [Polyangiaceae bacterium]